PVRNICLRRWPNFGLEKLELEMERGLDEEPQKLEKSDLNEHCKDFLMPMQLRMLGEHIYGRGPGGMNGTAMIQS
ncbi:hypothetical protein BG011_000955, partial [Mortierella polycephala]